MDDGILVTLLVTLFGLNYGAMWALYHKLDGQETAIRILCREHRINHGGDEIKC